MIKKYKKEMGEIFHNIWMQTTLRIRPAFTLVDYIICLLWMEFLGLIEF